MSSNFCAHSNFIVRRPMKAIERVERKPKKLKATVTPPDKTAALLADEKLDAEIRAKRAADPNWNNREGITTAIDIFQGKIPRAKAMSPLLNPLLSSRRITPACLLSRSYRRKHDT